VSRFLAFSSSFTMRRLSPLDSLAKPISASSSATCLSTKRLKYAFETGRNSKDGGRRSRRHSFPWQCGPWPAGDCRSQSDPSRQRRAELAGTPSETPLPTGPQVIRNERTSAFREILTAEFHRGGGHGPGLARSHDMRQQWATPLKDAPDRVFLVCREITVARDVRTIPGRVRCEPSKSRSRRLLNRKLYS